MSQDQRELSVSKIYEYCNANCNPFGEHENAVMAKTTTLSQKGSIARTSVPLSQVLEWCRQVRTPEAGTHVCLVIVLSCFSSERFLPTAFFRYL